MDSNEKNFKVNLTKIVNVYPHSNADRLEICTVYGYDVITQKGTYKVGDSVIYIPIDSIIPQKLEDFLFPQGSKIDRRSSKNRIRQIRIRSVPSQGMIVSPSDIQKVYGITPVVLEKDYAEVLEIKKYEPPDVITGSTGKNRVKLQAKRNPYFKDYNGLNNIKWYPEKFKPDEMVEITEKIHGCVPFDTRISMADGSKKKICDIKIGDMILGMNETNHIVETKVLNVFNNGETDDWLKIKITKNGLNRGNSTTNLRITPNHEVFDPITSSYKSAGSLTLNDKCLTKTRQVTLSYLQEQIILGKLLGDGSLKCYKNSAHVSYGHVITDIEYLRWTNRGLGDLTDKNEDHRISGYGSKMVRTITYNSFHLKEKFESFISNGIKVVPNWVENELSPISMAFWYMDDGSLTHHKSQHDRVNFAVCGFTENDCDILLRGLLKFGIVGTYYKSGGYSRIRLNADQAEKFFLLVSPYIPPCMQRKLPERYRGGNGWLPEEGLKYKPDYNIQDIISIELFTPEGKKKERWDIETETHNYFASEILVHNSSYKAGILPYVPKTFWERLKHSFWKFFGMNQHWEYCYGSNNTQLQDRPDFTGYYGSNIYKYISDKYNIQARLQPGETLYGEVYGKTDTGTDIQKGYTYGATEPTLICFDMTVLQPNGTTKYLNPPQSKLRIEAMGLTYVPVLAVKSFGTMKENEEYTLGSSVLYPNQKVREGCVIKAVENYDQQNGEKKALKYISSAYLDNYKNSDGH